MVQVSINQTLSVFFSIYQSRYNSRIFLSMYQSRYNYLKLYALYQELTLTVIKQSLMLPIQFFIDLGDRKRGS